MAETNKSITDKPLSKQAEEATKEQDKTAAPADAEKLDYTFPDEGVVINATSLDDAVEQLKKNKKEDE